MKSASFALFFLLSATRALAGDTPMERLTSLLVGSFSSGDQAYADRSYRNATLRCVRIWPERTDGAWFYAEQALQSAPEQPYRQVVYQLTATSEGALELRSFALPDPIALTNAWREPVRFNKLVPSDLLAREGCTLTLQVQPDGSFMGTTTGQGCSSDLNGAAYATAELTIAPDRIVSWDRGYNAAGRQVWGPLNGGYVFKRVE
ncbi:MAG: chromophore lyase CpcT/CpeT [Opitutae bacterium]|nr:chromophore lyase CpcT/CpeT [Opitutae bacterium]